jgi:hypothetical protein
VYFLADNPTIGEPFIQIDPNRFHRDADFGYKLSEGETRTVTIGGHLFDLERRGDTDYKEMRLIAK